MAKVKAASAPSQPEKGNVLFLILIAVALFAALSYVVIQSTRSGNGDTSREDAKLRVARMHQFTVSISTAVTKLTLSNNCSIQEVDSRPPEEAEADGKERCNLFHPKGGGVPYPGGFVFDVFQMSGDRSRADDWQINTTTEIEDVGTTSGTLDSADIILLVNFGEKHHGGETACTEIRRVLGQTGPIPVAHDTIHNGIGNISGAEINGRMENCYVTDWGDDDEYIYYNVLLAR